MSGIDASTRNGHEVVTLRSAAIEAEVLPGKGGDVLSVRRRRDGLPILWTTPWGLRPRGAPSAAATSEGRLMESYAGGWQTVFPNGGDATAAQNTTWGMHGEVWLAAFAWRPGASVSAIDLETELVHSPFRVRKQVAVHGGSVTVTETVTHRGGHPVDVMWSQHPAFGGPFLSGDCRIGTTATRVIVDGSADPASDLTPGATAAWPHVPGPAGPVDLRRVPPPDARLARMAYLTGFAGGVVTIDSPRLGAGVRLTWDSALMPYAWYWLEAAGTPGFPWYQGAYVLGIEPATSVPGHGVAAAAQTALTLHPGESRTATVTLTVV